MFQLSGSYGPIHTKHERLIVRPVPRPLFFRTFLDVTAGWLIRLIRYRDVLSTTDNDLTNLWHSVEDIVSLLLELLLL